MAPPKHNLLLLVAANTGSAAVTVCVTATLGLLSQTPVNEVTYQVVVAEIGVVKLAAAPDCNTVVDVGVAYHL